MKYKWIEENELVLDIEKQTTIPVGNGTAAAIEFAAWLAEGNVPDAADVEPEQPVTCSSYEFLQRFTQAERIAIEASEDVCIKDFASLLKAAQEIDFDDVNTLAGMAYLVSLGLLTEERKNEILTH